MRKISSVLCLVLLLGGVAWTLTAQPEGVSAPSESMGDPALDAEIDRILAMTPEGRRAYLKGLDPAERKGLWYLVKRTSLQRAGNSPKVRGTGMGEGFPLTAEQRAAAGKSLQTKAGPIGTIQYDDGLPTTGFGGGAIVGNRFNTRAPGVPVPLSGTVSAVTAVVVPGPAKTSSSAGFVLLGPQTTMGGAFAITSTFTVATGVIDVVSFNLAGGTYTGSSFFVLFGDFASSYIPVFGTGTNLGQGHHGVVGYTGGMGPNITGTFNFGGALNASIRASGKNLPVELMTFDVD